MTSDQQQRITWLESSTKEKVEILSEDDDGILIKWQGNTIRVFPSGAWGFMESSKGGPIHHRIFTPHSGVYD